MRDNRNARTIQRNYIQKWRFLIAERQLVKAGKHPKFSLVTCNTERPHQGLGGKTPLQTLQDLSTIT